MSRLAGKHTAILCGTLWLCALSAAAHAQTFIPESEFVYVAKSHDTLIGLGRRLLREPRRWRELQTRNHIANPRRIPLGTPIRIPYGWLRTTAEAATVVGVSGAVLLDGTPASAGQSAPQGAVLRTGSDGSVTLDLADGSVITLQKSSELSLEEMQRIDNVDSAHDTQLQLRSGHLQTVVKPHGDIGRFEIRTPVAVSAVRGTQFRTAFDTASMDATTETLEGTVGVTSAAAAVAVAVPADFGTRVERTGAPLVPVRLLPPPDLAGLPGTNTTPQLHLQWTPVAGATRYRVQLAPDPDFHTLTADMDLAVPQLTLPAPPEGNFWLRVRSIDALGLEGLDAVRAIRQHLLPTPPMPLAPRPGTRIVGARTSFSWSSVADATHYRWQLARDGQFSAPVMQRDIEGATSVEVDDIAPDHYQWRVASINAQGEAGDWSAPQPFAQRPNPPSMQPPRLTRRTLEIHWEGAAASRYHVQVARDAGFTKVVIDRQVDGPSLSVRRPRPGTYYVRVQLADPGASGDPFGAPRQFEVPLRLWLRILLPIAAAALTLVR
jgi:hypothetical protein